MELKRESTERNDPRKHYHLVKRLRKAAQYSEQLVKLCAPKGGKVDGRTALDVQVKQMIYCEFDLRVSLLDVEAS